MWVYFSDLHVLRILRGYDAHTCTQRHDNLRSEAVSLREKKECTVNSKHATLTSCWTNLEYCCCERGRYKKVRRRRKCKSNKMRKMKVTRKQKFVTDVSEFVVETFLFFFVLETKVCRCTNTPTNYLKFAHTHYG